MNIEQQLDTHCPSLDQLKAVTVKLNSEIATAKRTGIELRELWLQRFVALVKSTQQIGKTLVAVKAEVGKDALRQRLIQSQIDFKTADAYMKVSQMKVDFEDLESVLRAAKVCGMVIPQVGLDALRSKLL